MNGQWSGTQERRRQVKSMRWQSSEKRTSWPLLAKWSSSFGERYVIDLLSLCLANNSMLQNGQGPVTIHQQNILTYPTLNIAQCPTLLMKMDTNTGTVVEIWNPHIKQWHTEDIDHSMSIKGWPELLIHFLGVMDCLGHKQLIGKEEHVGHMQLTVDRAK